MPHDHIHQPLDLVKRRRGKQEEQVNLATTTNEGSRLTAAEHGHRQERQAGWGSLYAAGGRSA